MSTPNRTRLYGLRLSALVALVALATGLGAPAADAQVLYGSIVGNVADPQGATIPGSTITITNKSTGLTRDVISSEDGTYTVANVLPGAYDVKVSLQGFREFVRTDVPVSAGQISRVDVRLDVGALSETVTVASSVQLLQTDKADVHTELRSKEIINLPLNQYRNYQTLINLVPGATPAAFQNSQSDTPGRSLATNVNGMDKNNNNTRVDGAQSVNIWLPHHTSYVAPSETIDTVNIATNNFDSAQGMAAGAAITVVTKSGTNDLKGSAFFFRNQDEFNARNFFDPSKTNSSISKANASINTGGGTVGGPIRRNKMFFFGAWERNLERDSYFDTYTVPTARMRNGDFGEVLGINPNFRLYDPATGNADGTGRVPFENNVIPANRISSIARTIQDVYPAPNVPGTNNGLQNNLQITRIPEAIRDNYDIKLNWNRSAAHQIWGKFSTMNADVTGARDLFIMGFDEGGVGQTNVYVYTFGNTWTLGPSMVLDGNFGINHQDHASIGADFGTNYGTDVFGLPGTNGSDPRQSGMPTINTGLAAVGNTANWTPVERHERSYTFSTNLTKLMGRHELRTGFDFVRHQLDHWQPEIGPGPRGAFSFSGNITGATGYTSNAWNQYAAFLLGASSSNSKSIQFETMTGRENQYGFFVNDRWQASDKLTVTLGLRYEYYPLMSRADRGIERLDYNTFNVLLGGVGNVPEDLGIEVSKSLFSPRLGVAYRLNEETVFRAGYGSTVNPLPWSRPLRGFYPLTIAYSDTVVGNFSSFPLASGIKDIPLPDISSGVTPLPRGIEMRTPNPTDVDRGRIHQWNLALERRIPMDLSVSLAYVGTATDGSYVDINQNYAEAGGGEAGRQYFAQAGSTNILDWGSRGVRRYHALQMAINRPFKGGLLLKGAYTWGKAMNEHDDDGWVTYSYNQPSQMDRNYALAGYDRKHIFQMGFLYDLPFAKEQTGVLPAIIQNWQINGIFSAFTGTPFSIGGDNTALNQRAGLQTIEQVAEIRDTGERGPDAPMYEISSFAQPGNQWGNTGRNFLRGSGQWNLDFGLFRGFPIGAYRIEFRAMATNVLNHTRWANPVTGFTDPNFLRLRSVQDPRRVTFGARFEF